RALGDVCAGNRHADSDTSSRVGAEGERVPWGAVGGGRGREGGERDDRAGRHVGRDGGAEGDGRRGHAVYRGARGDVRAGHRHPGGDPVRPARTEGQHGGVLRAVRGRRHDGGGEHRDGAHRHRGRDGGGRG